MVSEVPIFPTSGKSHIALLTTCQTGAYDTAMAKAKKPSPGIDEQLRTAIVDSGLTAYMVAKRAGTTPGVVGRFVSGERDIRLATAAKIAKVLGLELKPVDK